MNKLADMAAQQRTAVICSLHVPRSSIFDRLDDVMLLSAGGRVCYMGPAHEALAYFRALGFECPTHHNPAEFLVDLISVDSSPEVQAEDERRVLLLQQAWERRVFKFTHDLQDAQVDGLDGWGIARGSGSPCIRRGAMRRGVEEI